MNCLENGDYAPVQCLGSVCYCVHPLTGEKHVDAEETHIANYSDITCETSEGKLLFTKE